MIADLEVEGTFEIHDFASNGLPVAEAVLIRLAVVFIFFARPVGLSCWVPLIQISHERIKGIFVQSNIWIGSLELDGDLRCRFSINKFSLGLFVALPNACGGKVPASNTVDSAVVGGSSVSLKHIHVDAANRQSRVQIVIVPVGRLSNQLLALLLSSHTLSARGAFKHAVGHRGLVLAGNWGHLERIDHLFEVAVLLSVTKEALGHRRCLLFAKSNDAVHSTLVPVEVNPISGNQRCGVDEILVLIADLHMFVIP